MRTIDITKIGRDLSDLLDQKDPTEEDIGIVDGNGNIVGIIISKDTYDFFLKMIEKEEDRQDRQTVKEFHDSGENK